MNERGVHGCSTTALSLTTPHHSTDQQEACADFLEHHEQEQEALLKRDSKIHLVPIIVAILSFTLFPQTQQVFHAGLEVLSLGRYSGELSEDIRPLINGPVTLTISILFGSLVSMTIGTLYTRQTDIHQTGIEHVNELRHMQYLAEGLPEPERSMVKARLNQFTMQRLQNFFRGDMFAKEQRRVSISPLLLLLQQAQRNDTYQDGPYMGELYASLAKLKDVWSEYVAAYLRNFTPAHYVNLTTQAMTLLLIYLWETDDLSLLEAHGFELRVAWSILLSTMASLAAIIVDLSTPISNIITMIRTYEVDMEEAITSGLAKDLEGEKVRMVSELENAGSTWKE